MAEERILVVEDETLVAMDIARGLRDAGYSVVAIVDNAESAVAAAEMFEPDLILMDVRLKGELDGVEAARRIRATRDVPVIFLTAYADQVTVERAKAVAPHGYLSKPFDERELHRVIALALTRSAAERAGRERVEQALWESEERFRLLLDAVTDYALVLVDEQGRVAAWNLGAERVYGWPADEILGRPILRLYPSEVAGSATLEAEIDAVREAGRTESEGWRVRKDGSKIWVRIVRTVVNDPDGTFRGFAGVAQDITARRELETQLLRAQRFDAIGKLAGGIAHDFNNMLMIVLSRSEDLLRTVGAKEPEKHYVENIKQAALRSTDLTRQLLATARREILRPEVVELSELVASTMRLLERSIGEDIRIVTELSAPPWKIYADPSKLHQVLLNLALNARDAMPSGGTLTVETRNFHAESDYTRQHPVLNEGDYALLVVSDTGCGIAPEHKERIWEPFFSTKAIGTGLGLSVVRGVVEQMGGQIWMYSELGEGTTFKIYFPRHFGVAEQRTASAAEPHPAHGSETILLVEDEALLRAMVRDALEECGYNVLEAPAPDHALAMSRRFDGAIHLLLTDMVMPGMNGVELAARLRLERPGLPVILMSGYPGGAIANAQTVAPDTKFLEKPIPSTRLLREVRECLDRRIA
jgi:PAS domain S-box-containing protein